MISGSPTISLIIPCFNHADSLIRSTQSGLLQSHLYELIIVDDHSTDGTFRIGHELATRDTRIRVLQTPVNLGPGGARNTGAHHARGEYLCFLDADDEIIGDFFQDACQLMADRPEMHAVKGEMEFYDPIKGYILPVYDPRHASVVLSSSCGIVMSREIFLRLGGFPEDPVFRGPLGGEDVAFMQALMAHYQPIGRIDRPCYRVWSTGQSHVDRFLASTRLKGNSFEFVSLHPDQQPAGPLQQALASYLERTAERVKPSTFD